MNCPVCQNATTVRACAICGFDTESAAAKDPRAVLAARDAFRARTLSKRVVISTWDKWRPWAALVLGFLIFAAWMRACSHAGWPF